MKNREWVIIIAVVLVVAVAVSLITANITGNVVIRQGFGSRVQVTNKAEVLDMLSKSYLVNIGGTYSENSEYLKNSNCQTICSNKNAICVLGFEELYPGPQTSILSCQFTWSENYPPDQAKKCLCIPKD